MDDRIGLRLEELPTELLRQIAIHCPAETYLRLVQVSRSLRRKLLDKYVIKDIVIENRLRCQVEDQAWKATARQDDPVAVRVRSVTPSLLAEDLETLLGDDVHAWTRLAVAESEQWQLNEILQQYFNGRDHFCQSRPYQKLRLISSAEEKQLEQEALKIICGYGPSLTTLLHPGSLHDEANVHEIIHAVAVACEQGPDSYPNSGDAQYALGATAYLLMQHINRLRVSEPQIPRLQDLPWIATGPDRKIPIPFPPERSPDDPITPFVSWKDWEADCIHRMTDPDFIEDGQWVGYWSFDGAALRGTPSVQFADSISGLVLKVQRSRRSTRRSSQCPTPFRIRGSYPNSEDDFHLEGTYTRDGCFQLGPPGDFW
ncbi:MAG: hypothetical protein M1820_010918, partial [Bogoriella megaspora]